ncbi:MAG: hypothetical protein SVC26_03545 [Pseudomonadota bacterium]|nr:hypothetical protein [Pseudomonadota bacterium]
MIKFALPFVLIGIILFILKKADKLSILNLAITIAAGLVLILTIVLYPNPAREGNEVSSLHLSQVDITVDSASVTTARFIANNQDPEGDIAALDLILEHSHCDDNNVCMVVEERQTELTVHIPAQQHRTVTVRFYASNQASTDDTKGNKYQLRVSKIRYY